MNPLIRKDLEDIARQAGIDLARELTPDAASKSAAVGGKTISPALRAAGQAALDGWKASEDYADLQSRLDSDNLNLYELTQRLKRALDGPHFSELLAQIRTEALDLNPLGLVPKAISLGVLGEIAFGVGASGSFGYVINLDVDDPDAKIYLGGAVDWGLEAVLEGDAALGFWSNKTDDIPGLYVGAEVDVDPGGFGGSAAAFEQKEELALVFLCADVGEGGGFENTDFYFFTFDLSQPSIYQSGDADYYLQFTQMSCLNSKDNYDTIYFEFSVDGQSTEYRFPAWNGNQMCESKRSSTLSSWDIGLLVKFNDSVKVKLHVGDHEMPSKTLNTGNFNGVGSTAQLDFDDKVDVINEIHYTLGATLLKDGS